MTVPQKEVNDTMLKEAMAGVRTVIGNLDKITNLALKAGVAYAGMAALGHWSGAIVGLTGLHMAQSPNLIAGGAGVGVLAGIGATNLVKPIIIAAQSDVPPPDTMRPANPEWWAPL